MLRHIEKHLPRKIYEGVEERFWDKESGSYVLNDEERKIIDIEIMQASVVLGGALNLCATRSNQGVELEP